MIGIALLCALARFWSILGDEEWAAKISKTDLIKTEVMMGDCSNFLMCPPEYEHIWRIYCKYQYSLILLVEIEIY